MLYVPVEQNFPHGDMVFKEDEKLVALQVTRDGSMSDVSLQLAPLE